MSDPALIRILIVDDHGLFREGLRELLTAHASLSVVGEASDYREAVAAVAALDPDVVLLDVGIPGGHVTSAVRELRRPGSRPHIIILTMYDDPTLLHRLLTLGIRGYLLKTASRQQLVSAILATRGAADDQVTLSVSRVSLTSPAGAAPDLLTGRELAVLMRAAKALSNGQIARELALTEATVKRHMRNIFAKLGAVSRMDAVQKAAGAGLLSPGGTDGWN